MKFQQYFHLTFFSVALKVQTHFIEIRPCAIINSTRCTHLRLYMPTGMEGIHSNQEPLTCMQKDLGFGTKKYQAYILPQLS